MRLYSQVGNNGKLDVKITYPKICSFGIFYCRDPPHFEFENSK